MKIVYKREEQLIHISSPKLIMDILKKQNLTECNAIQTPIEVGSDIESEKEEHHQHKANSTIYRNIVGTIMYLSLSCRPDLSYVSNFLARKLQSPNTLHLAIAKRTLRYLKGSMNQGISYDGKETQLTGYSDASYAREREDRTSTTGYIVEFCGGPVSWKSKKHVTVSLSTLEAEYRAATECFRDTLGIAHTLSEMKQGGNKPAYLLQKESTLAGDMESIGIKLPVTIHEDNKGTISTTHTSKLYERTKHWAVNCFWLREQAEHGIVKLEYCPTNKMKADLLTKALAAPRFQELKAEIGVRDITL
jgi:hypothetical protein